MIAHFSELLKAIAKQPNQKVGALRMLSITEEKHLLNDFNNTFSPYPKDKSIADLFEEQVIKTPVSIAAIFEGQELTYQQLNERSNQLAHYLQTKGIKNGDLVPICIERGLEMIIGLFGILKTGGTFIPIRPRISIGSGNLYAGRQRRKMGGK
jgi:non-ribosomal peptide synthetase component F